MKTMHTMLDVLTSVASRRPHAAGSVWDYVSPSRLNLWLRCPLAFKLRYIDGIKTPTTESLFLGQRVHAGLETLYRSRMDGLRLNAKACIQTMLDGWEQAAAEQRMRFENPDQEQQLKQQASGLVRAYLCQVPADEQVIAVESRFQVPLVDPATGADLGIPLVGIIDLVLDTDVGPVIVDFKTAARSSAPIELMHEVQLSAYAHLVRQNLGGQESQLQIRSLVKTKVPKVETHMFLRREQRHFERLFGVIIEYLQALETGTFNYRPSWTCGMCDFLETHCQAPDG